jgi:hypothetical protein
MMLITHFKSLTSLEAGIDKTIGFGLFISA